MPRDTLNMSHMGASQAKMACMSSFSYIGFCQANTSGCLCRQFDVNTYARPWRVYQVVMLAIKAGSAPPASRGALFPRRHPHRQGCHSLLHFFTHPPAFGTHKQGLVQQSCLPTCIHILFRCLCRVSGFENFQTCLLCLETLRAAEYSSLLKSGSCGG